ncbi:MAG: NYN domain-containing protein [Saccharofermentans sp.]|jgi:uncharacterized LabA/DUF88 family protein|nr:NYN domain-containing protein [Saccharofermentans sp.]
MIRTAILVDGGFYRKRAKVLKGELSGKDRAKELFQYCMSHINGKNYDGSKNEEKQTLYRIFYYDCMPLNKRYVFHPLSKQNVDLGKSDSFDWTESMFNELRKTRKVALRLGELSTYSNYNLKPSVTKNLFLGKIKLEDIKVNDFELNIKQKGVDMKIGIDIASLAYKKQVDRIILIAGDSDFVPAAKTARREGIDFILDPMWTKINDNLFEHIDGLMSVWPDPSKTTK